MLTIEGNTNNNDLSYPLLHLGFRPFFLGAAGLAILSMGVWMALYFLGWQGGLAGLSLQLWHAHELIYGYAVAVIAGFLLTAVKNWTGVQTVHRFPLLALFTLWLLARAASFIHAEFIVAMMAGFDMLFMGTLLAAISYPVIKARQWRQLLVILHVALLLCGNLVFYMGALGWLSEGLHWGLYAGLYVILSLIFVIGRRVIPFFIERGVDNPVALKNWSWLDVSTVVLFAIFAVLDVFTSYHGLIAGLAGILFVMHGIKMAGWYTAEIFRKPLLWVLYLAYGFLVVGFALKFFSYVLGVSPYLAIHAFAVGGIGVMTVGMMARVILGHTGRNISEPPAILFPVFAALLGSAAIRVFLPLFDSTHYQIWIAFSQILWISAFTVFLWNYFPMLVQPRVDGRYG